MANKSECIRAVRNLKLSDTSCSMVTASSDLESVSALASGSEHATTSSSQFLSTRGEWSKSVEEQIERSKSHWSQLVESDSDDDKAAEIDNVDVFKALQMHPTRGDFFVTFGDGGIYDLGELEVGCKFAEGGQAELYEAQVKWRNPKNNERDLREGLKWVLKVFKKGTFLRHLQLQLPPGLFQEHADDMKRLELGLPLGLQYGCEVDRGTLLRDGRFAFVLGREHGDLRSRIDHKMMKRARHDRGPFDKDRAELIMYDVALGMEWLHNLNIVHRDLKASNVLYRKDTDGWDFVVADYECSIGVVGTGFWRAPEILQACKDKVASRRPDLFTKAVDVYSYGMTCYEILTGKSPFDGHPTNNYDLVLKGQQPELPNYVEDWVCDLLCWCWQSDPAARPTFRDILDFLLANSAEARRLAEQIKKLTEKLSKGF